MRAFEGGCIKTTLYLDERDLLGKESMARKTFAELAQQEGAIQVHDFKQLEFLKKATGTPEPDGKCFAFVLAYFTCLRTGAYGKDLFDALGIAVEKNDQAVIKEILGNAAVSSDPNWMGTDLFNITEVNEPAYRVLHRHRA